MVRFSDPSVVVDNHAARPSGRWSPDYHYAGGAAPPSPGGSIRGSYMTGPVADPVPPPGYSAMTQAPPKYQDDSPTSPTRPQALTRENSLQVPHWDRYRPRSVPPPLSPTMDNATMDFPPPRSRSRNHDREQDRDRDRQVYHDRDRNDTRRRGDNNKGRHRDRHYDSESSSDDDKSRADKNKPATTKARTTKEKARHTLSSTFSDSTSGLGASVIGAVLGGLAAREASEKVASRHGNGHHAGSKEALFSTILGAAAGGAVGNAFGKKFDESRKKHQATGSSGSSYTSSVKGDHNEKNYTWGEKNAARDRERGEGTRRDRSRSQRRGSKDTGGSYRDFSDDDDSDDQVVYDHRRRRNSRDRSRVRRDGGDDWRGGR